MTPPTRGHALLRRAVLELALTEDFCKRFADPRQVQPYTYAASPLTSGGDCDRAFTAGPVAGAALPNCRLASGDFLLDHLGAEFTGLLFLERGEIAPEVHALFAGLAGAAPGFRPLLVVRRAEGVPPGALVDAEGRVAHAFGAQDGSFYLVRPDRHVAARWPRIEAGAVRAALRRACAGASP